MADSKKAQIQIEDHFYDGNPKKAFSLVPEPGGGWRIKPLDLYQEVPVSVLRNNPEGESEVILQVGSSTSNLYDPQHLPLLQEGDEISVGMVNQFIVTRSAKGVWELKPKDSSVEIRVSFPKEE